MNYYRCRAARDASFSDKAVETSGPNLGFITGGEERRIGSLDSQGAAINLCFVGSRTMKGNVEANQNISLTFDPATLICIACESEHRMLSSDSPVCVCVTDQNFPANISGNGNCVSIVRLESASLSELGDLCGELFDSATFPPGSVIGLGSASHLHRVGCTLYAIDWKDCAAQISRKFPGLQVFPLIPIIVTPIPGSLACELVQLASWYAKIYECSALGLVDTWAKLAACLTDPTAAPAPRYSTVALPASLAPGAALTPHRFLDTSPRRVLTPGLDAKASGELIHTLLVALHSNLGIRCFPGPGTVREPKVPQIVKDEITHLVLIGASHMRRVAPILRDRGYTVLEYSLPGGVPTDENLEALLKDLQRLQKPAGTALVFDLFGNFVYRFRQIDGSMVLPVNIGGTHHLLGDVGVCSDQAFTNLVSKLVPVLSLHPECPKVVLPPIPRYLKGGCCQQAEHATNTRDESNCENILEKISHLRKILRNELKKSDIDGYWIADTLSALAPPADMTAATLLSSATEIPHLMLSDNVHLSHMGYTRLGEGITGSLDSILTKKGKDCVVIGEKKRFFWRGFTSERGSSSRPATRGGGNFNRGRGKNAQMWGSFAKHQGGGGARGPLAAAAAWHPPVQKKLG